MKTYWKLTLALVVLGSLGLKAEDKPAAGPLAAYGRLAAKAETVYFEAKVEATDDGERKSMGPVRLWAEKKTGRYALQVDRTRVRNDTVSTNTKWLVHTADGTVAWQMRDGALMGARRGPMPKDSKLPSYVYDLEPLCLVYDGLYGYELIQEQLQFKPDTPAGHEEDGLHWFVIEKQPKDEETELYDEIDLHEVTLWLGFSPKDGWIHKMVFHVAREQTFGEITLTKLDLKPDLAGAFDIPAEVGAELVEQGATTAPAEE